MATATKKQRVRAALAGEPVDRPPVSLWGHDFLREWTAGDLVASTLDAYRPYDWDFIKFNPRATYFAEAWGNRYEPPAEQRQPALVSHAVSTADDLLSLQPADIGDGVFGEHLHALSMLMRATDGSVDVLHTVFSPLAVAAQLCGTPDAFLGLAKDAPDGLHAALRTLARTLAAYARAGVEAGASGVFFAPLIWASHDHASDEFYVTFGRPYDLEVLDAAQGAPFNVLHVCRNHNMLTSLLDYPVSAFNWADHGAGNPALQEIRSRTGKAVMGGIDHATLHTASPAEVAAQAREAMSLVGTGLFVTGGCAIPPSTPAENRRAVFEAVRQAG